MRTRKGHPHKYLGTCVCLPPAPALALIMVLAVALGLAGCGSVKGWGNGSDAEAVSTPAPSGYAEPLHAPGTLRNCQTVLSWQTCATRGGLYEIVSLPAVQDPAGWSVGNGSRILYTDYATRQQTPLCAQPQCAHNDETCAAWLPHDGSNYYLFEADGGLVLIFRGQELWEGEGEQHAPSGYIPASVDRLDYNGSNRRQLAQMPVGDTFIFEVYITDDSFFYTIRVGAMPDSADPDSHYDRKFDLIAIDLKTGELQEKYQLDLRREEGFFDVMGDELVFRRHDFPRLQGSDFGEGQEGFDAWEENMMAGRTHLFAVSTKTWQARDLAPDLPVMYLGLKNRIYDGKIYYSVHENGDDPSADTYEMDVETGEAQLVLPGEEEGEVIVFRGILDGRMIFTRFGKEKRNESLFCREMPDGEDREVVLTTQNPDWDGQGTYTTPMIPIADAGEYYLVVLEYLKIGDYGRSAVRGLILKEDYWAGKANYLPVTVVGNGTE